MKTLQGRRISPVQAALDAAIAAVQRVGVDHGGAYVTVPEQLLDGANVVAVRIDVFRTVGGGERKALTAFLALAGHAPSTGLDLPGHVLAANLTCQIILDQGPPPTQPRVPGG